jgi:hypothetical protein
MHKFAICFLLCAWIMWQEAYLNNVREEIQIIEAFGGIHAEAECKANLSALREGLKELKGPKGIVSSRLICLPDSVKIPPRLRSRSS